MTPRTKELLKAGGKLAVTLALLAVSLRLVHLGTVWESLRHARPGPLAAAGALLALGGFAGAASWYCVLRTHLTDLGYRTVAACHWKGMFFNSFLPSNVGGDVVKGYIVSRDQGQTGFVVASLLVDRALNLGMLLSIGVFAFLLHLGHPFGALAWVGLLGLGIAGGLAAAVRLRRRIQAWPQAGLRGKAAGWLVPVCDLASTPRLLFPALLAALLSQVLKTWQNVFVVLALGLSVPTGAVWYVIPVFGIVSALPVSIGGLGVRELVAQWLSGPLAIDNTHLVTFSLASHLMVALVNMLGALAFLRGSRRPPTPRADGT